MSGYVFPCTPCGFAHAGECRVLDCGCKGKCRGHVDESPPEPGKTALPPSGWVQTTPVGGPTVTIQVGDRFRLEHQYPGDPKWYSGPGIGYHGGYEVMAIVAQGFSVAVQMREWNAPQYPIYTCSLQWWDVNGNGASDGGRNRFSAWA